MLLELARVSQRFALLTNESFWENIPALRGDIPVVAPISLRTLSAAFGRLEQEGLTVVAGVFPPEDFADVRVLQAEYPHVFDQVKDPAEVGMGIRSYLWGAAIFAPHLPSGTVRLLGHGKEGWGQQVVLVTR